jgi:hypothetical protein
MYAGFESGMSLVLSVVIVTAAAVLMCIKHERRK